MTTLSPNSKFVPIFSPSNSPRRASTPAEKYREELDAQVRDKQIKKQREKELKEKTDIEEELRLQKERELLKKSFVKSGRSSPPAGVEARNVWEAEQLLLRQQEREAETRRLAAEKKKQLQSVSNGNTAESEKNKNGNGSEVRQASIPVSKDTDANDDVQNDSNEALPKQNIKSCCIIA
eukprot:g1584.t1